MKWIAAEDWRLCEEYRKAVFNWEVNHSIPSGRRLLRATRELIDFEAYVSAMFS